MWGSGSPLRQFLYNIDFGKLLVRTVYICVCGLLFSGFVPQISPAIVCYRCGRCATMMIRIPLSCLFLRRRKFPLLILPRRSTVSPLTCDTCHIYARVPTFFILQNKLMAHAFLITTKMVCNVNRSWCLTQRRQMGNSRRLLIIREYNDIFLGMHFFMHLLPPNQL